MKQLTIDVYTELGENIVEGMFNCDDKSCLVILALAASIPVGTYVISGSIVLANNTLYWLETQLKCKDETYSYSPLE